MSHVRAWTGYVSGARKKAKARKKGRVRARRALAWTLACSAPQLPPPQGSRRPAFCAPLRHFRRTIQSGPMTIKRSTTGWGFDQAELKRRLVIAPAMDDWARKQQDFEPR